ncbi:MAG: hypothetical protein AABZ12_12495 [Planctomycetota bacterium]
MSRNAREDHRLHGCGEAAQSSIANRQSPIDDPQSAIGNSRLAIAVTLALLLGGCTGHATIHMVPLGNQKISAADPLIVRQDPHECYYWLNDVSQVCVAMRFRHVSWLGKAFSSELVLSLVLDKPPAGAARDYRVDRFTERHRLDAGFTHLRGASLSGIIGTWDYGKRQLKGRFRFTAKQQSFFVLTGWGSDHSVLFVGEFTAVHDRAAGEKILQRTEADGMGRSTPKIERD